LTEIIPSCGFEI